jgi:hypothetical protein
MITDAHAKALMELGTGFVSALKTVQIRKLISSGDLQLSRFDQRNLAEIIDFVDDGNAAVIERAPAVSAEPDGQPPPRCRMRC